MKRTGLKLRITLGVQDKTPLYDQELHDVVIPRNLTEEDVAGLLANAINMAKLSIPQVSRNKRKGAK